MSSAALAQQQPAKSCTCAAPKSANTECPECSAHAPVLQRSVSESANRRVTATMAGTPPISSGQALDPATRREMEAGFGTDFSGVRVHTDAAAATSVRSVGADAYTLGSSIAFDTGRYDPTSAVGRGLLAHELAHVVQQRGHVPTPGALPVEPQGTAPEFEADRAAARVLSGVPSGPLSTVSGLGVQRGRVAGCDVPHLSNTQIGVAAHREIQRWAVLQDPPCRAEVAIPGGACSREETGNIGYADLLNADPSTNQTAIGEIKPISQRLSPDPWRQLECYKRYYGANNPNRTVSSMTWLPAPPENPSLFFPTTNPQYLNCSAPTDGVYFYWCTKSRRRRERRWRPEPVRIPKEVWDRITQELKDWRERMRRFPVDVPLPVPERVPAPGEEPVPEEIPDDERAPETEPVPEEQPVPAPERPPGEVVPIRPRPAPAPAPAPEELPLAARIALGVLLAIAVVIIVILLLPEEIVAAAAAAILLALRAIAGLAPALGAGALTFGTAATASAAEGGHEGSGTGSGRGSGSGGERGAASGSQPGSGATDGSPARAQTATGGSAPQPQVGGREGGTTGPQRPATPGGTGAEGAARDGARRVQELRDATAAADDVVRGAPRRPRGRLAPEGPTSPGAAPRLATTSEVPPGTRTQFPISIVRGLDRTATPGTTRNVTVIIGLAPSFTVDVKLTVVTNIAGNMVLEVAEPWYAPERSVGSPQGARYTYSFRRGS